jgi:hypothetical protein
MNTKLKQMWDSIRQEKMPSHKDFRPLWDDTRTENKLTLKNHPDFHSKERRNVR